MLNVIYILKCLSPTCTTVSELLECLPLQISLFSIFMKYWSKLLVLYFLYILFIVTCFIINCVPNLFSSYLCLSPVMTLWSLFHHRHSTPISQAQVLLFPAVHRPSLHDKVQDYRDAPNYPSSSNRQILEMMLQTNSR